MTTRANLLVIKGVSLNDFLNLPTTTTASAITPVAQISKQIGPLDTIPSKFTGVADWPKSTNLLCHSCTLPFNTYPKFIAVNPSKDSNGKDICDTEGNYCTWNCGARVVMRDYPENQWLDLLWGLCTFEAVFTGRRREKILPSPPPNIMRQFCGEKGLTPEQYQERIAELNRDYDLTTYKMEHFARPI